MSGRSYLSIGEVLTLLRQEFSDITISKIRFLEAQGLVNPERTPSGYRKFYDHDVDRLRWVLQQQREHFLPLKVIKGRLEDEPETPGEPAGPQLGIADAAAEAANADPPAEVVVALAEATAATAAVGNDSPAAGAGAGTGERTLDDVVEAARAASRARVMARQGAGADGGPGRQIDLDGAHRDGADREGADGDAPALPGFEPAPVTAAVGTAGSGADAGAARDVTTGATRDGTTEGAPAATTGETAHPQAPAYGGRHVASRHGSGRAVAPRTPAAPARPGTTKPSDLPHLAAAPSAPAASTGRRAGGEPRPGTPAASGPGGPARPGPVESGEGVTGAGADPAAAGSSESKDRSPAGVAGGPGVVILTGGASMTLEELAAAAELTSADIGQLESFGLLSGRLVGGIPHYDEAALTVARLAGGFARYGVEPRHLRLYKNAADREAGFIEQLVVPLLKQRNPTARQRANDTAAELSRLGQGLRAALVQAMLHQQLGG